VAAVSPVPKGSTTGGGSSATTPAERLAWDTWGYSRHLGDAIDKAQRHIDLALDHLTDEDLLNLLVERQAEVQDLLRRAVRLLDQAAKAAQPGNVQTTLALVIGGLSQTAESLADHLEEAGGDDA
jgi:hypothetical protein